MANALTKKTMQNVSIFLWHKQHIKHVCYKSNKCRNAELFRNKHFLTRQVVWKQHLKFSVAYDKRLL